MNNKKIELLAPSGTYESLVAAIQNGADAIYLGGVNFGARTNAGNFDNDELTKAVKYAHVRNVKIYVTVNTLINDDEMQECIEYITFLYNSDVDAVIIQDLGLASVIKNIFPDLEIHASTQMSIANTLDADFAKNMGFSRAVVARENSLAEMDVIKKATGLEIEAFVHGALCVSYSGKCLFSFIQGGRSGNRGSCAQPCRMKYDLKDQKGTTLLENKYVLSMKDLSTINEIETLVNSDIDSLKIEGRMRRPEYVATVVKNYRTAMDGILNGTITPEELQKLEDEIKYVFNRDYTKGHISKATANQMVNLESPKNKGVYLGTVLEVNSNTKRIKIKLEDDLRKGDGLSLGEYVGRIIAGKEIKNDAKNGETIELDYIGKAEPGTKVYKTYNKTIMDNATESYRKENKKTPISCSIYLKLGESPKLTITDDQNNEIVYSDEDYFVEEAINKPVDDSVLEKQMSKLESTAFYLESLKIEKDENISIPMSELNKLRREAILILEEKRENRNSRNFISMETTEKALEDLMSDPDENIFIDQQDNNTKAKIAVKCFTKEQIRACLDLDIERIYLSDTALYKEFSKIDSKKYHYLTSGILKDADIASFESFMDEYKPNILTSSLGYAAEIIAKYEAQNTASTVGIDYMANLNNRLATKYAKTSLSGKVDTITPGIEYVLNQENLDFVISEKDKKEIEIPVAIHPILMITEYCPYKSNGKNCGNPKCAIDNAYMHAENSEVYIMKKDDNCKVHIYNQKITELHKDSVRTLKADDYSRFRIDLLDEDYDQTMKLINKYKNI
ncbi:MAG: U32 family peptidase [Proteocatella sp.]